MSSPVKEGEVRKSEQADPFRFGWRFVRREDERGQMVQVQQPLTYEDVLHPQEDDFIVQNTAHRPDVSYLFDVFEWRLNGREDVRLWSDLRIDWGVEGVEPHGPDVSLFEGAREREAHPLATYHPKQYGARPTLVVEVTSPSTRSQDLHDKVAEYYRAGVPFYAIVDYLPEFDWKKAVVLGYRATPEGYLRSRLDEKGRLWLEPVRLWLGWDEGRAVCYDERGNRIAAQVETRRRLDATDSQNEELRHAVEESITARQDAEKRAKDAEQRAKDLEAELRRLRGDA